VGINGEMSFSRGSVSGSYVSGQIGMDHFDIVKVIGRGSFGKVYLVRKKDDGKVFAMKTLKKDMIIRKNQTENTKGNLLALLFRMFS